MQRFSIKDLESFTGIKAHTIRVWEQRYSLLNPERTATNIRYYTNSDLKTLLNVNLLNKRGFKISKIAELSDKEIEKIIADDHDKEVSDEQHYLNLLKVAMLNYDELLFHDVTDGYFEKHSVQETFVKLFLPFMKQLGVLWLTNAICPAQEHFISNLIRQKLCRLIDEIKSKPIDEDEDTYVLYLPEGEWHDVSLLLAHYLLKSNGMRSVYLGQSVPFDDLAEVVGRCNNVKFISFCSTQPPLNRVKDYLTRISKDFEGKGVKFHLTGDVFKGTTLDRPEWMKVYSGAEDLMKAIFLKKNIEA